MTMQVSITPWPSYDEHLRAWWRVSVKHEQISFALSWTNSNGGRWADGNELMSAKRKSRMVVSMAEQSVRETFSCAAQQRDMTQCSNVTEDGLSVTSGLRDTSRARKDFCHYVTSRIV